MPDLTTADPDLGILLDTGPWTRYQKAVVALTASAVVFDGLDIQIVGYAIPACLLRRRAPHPSIQRSHPLMWRSCST